VIAAARRAAIHPAGLPSGPGRGYRVV